SDVEPGLPIDRHGESTFGLATAFVEEGLCVDVDRHASGEVPGAHETVERGVDQSRQFGVRYRAFRPVGIERRIVHRYEMRLYQMTRLGRIRADDKQAELTGAACLDHHLQQAGPARIAARIEQVDATAIACRRAEVRDEIRLVVLR